MIIYIRVYIYIFKSRKLKRKTVFVMRSTFLPRRNIFRIIIIIIIYIIQNLVVFSLLRSILWCFNKKNLKKKKENYNNNAEKDFDRAFFDEVFLLSAILQYRHENKISLYQNESRFKMPGDGRPKIIYIVVFGCYLTGLGVHK